MARRLRDPRRRVQDLRAASDALALRLPRAMARRLALARSRLDASAHRLAMQDPGARAATLRRTVAVWQHRLDLAGRRALVGAQDRVARAAASLDDLSPLAVLRRGYGLVRRVSDGAIVRSARALTPGDEIHVSFAEGSARAHVTTTDDGRHGAAPRKVPQ